MRHILQVADPDHGNALHVGQDQIHRLLVAGSDVQVNQSDRGTQQDEQIRPDFVAVVTTLAPTTHLVTHVQERLDRKAEHLQDDGRGVGDGGQELL